MGFNWVDIVILLLLAFFIVREWRAGFVLAVGRIVSLIIGIFVAAFTWPWVGEAIESIGLGWWAVVVVFLLVVGIVSKLAMLLFMTLDYVRRGLSIIPFVSTINRLLGVLIGAAEGVIVVMAAVYFLALALPTFLFLQPYLDASILYGYVTDITYRATLLFPNFPFST